MRYTASVYINDVMDQVVVCCRVFGDDGVSTRTTKAYELVDQVQGVGETDPQEWLKDALVAIVEAL